MPWNQWTILPLAAVLCLATRSAPLLSAADEVEKADVQLLREHRVGTSNAALIEVLRNNCMTAASRGELNRLFREMGSKAYVERQRASKKLVAAGPKALSFLRRALQDPDVEIARRAQSCIAAIERECPSAIFSAVARLLARRHPPGATEVLLHYLPDAYGSTTSEDVLEALLSLNKRSAKPDPVLLAALRDPVPARRVAAGYVLGRYRGAEIRMSVGKLLADRAAAVRVRAALGLAAGNEKRPSPCSLTCWPSRAVTGLACGRPSPAAGSRAISRPSPGSRHGRSA
jgi:hypothetical protein